MCGICGQFRMAREGSAVDPAELDLMNLALAHRGPDGEGKWTSSDGRVGLGHRRLAILDLSAAGAQPMTSFDGRFVLVFNGEIYNFHLLRDELVRSGVRFTSCSDTEVLVELWRRDGVAALDALRGMYALALWDRDSGELVLARDPYGIKPLYYSTAGGVLRFASQVKALEATGAVPLELDPEGVRGFLSWGAIPEPFTLRRAVRALPAGHLLRIDGTGVPRLEPRPWRAPAGAPLAPAAALAESVRDHLVSDVPVALFLSAGIDSALIAALARRALPEPPVALTLTWAEARGTGADEEPLARATAARLGLRHLIREVSGAEIREQLPRIVAAMDQPSIDGFNTWLIAKVARAEGFKVALSGLGGDELLGGYASFRDVPRWARWASRLDRIPGLTRLWPAVARRFVPSRPKLAGALADGGSLSGAYALRRGLFRADEIDALLPQFAGARTSSPAFQAWEALGSDILGDAEGVLHNPWRAVHRLESSLYLRHQLLRDADWAGMAHGLEIRVPLVDARLRGALEAASFEPARGRGKWAMAALAAPELPPELGRRPKSGFQLPIGDWLDAREPGRRPSRVGTQSRRLALWVLEQFDVELRLPASPEP